RAATSDTRTTVLRIVCHTVSADSLVAGRPVSASARGKFTLVAPNVLDEALAPSRRTKMSMATEPGSFEGASRRPRRKSVSFVFPPVSVGQRRNRARTTRSVVIGTLHPFKPLQAPPHPTSLAPFAGRARRATRVPRLNVAVQRGGHAIPAGLLATRPGPLTETVSLRVLLPNKARTRFSLSMVTVHNVFRLEQAPVQPRNTAFALGRASRRTVEPRSNSVEQAEGHSRPAGTLVTTPVPPATTRLTVIVTGSLPCGNGASGCQSTGPSANEAETDGTCVSPLPSRFMT